MKILTYDEVDHDQALLIHLSGFGWALTEEHVKAMVEHDARIWKPFGIYAVDKGRVLGQIVPFRIPTRTRDGVEDVLGVAEVVTAPGEAQKGIATFLMRRVEEMGVEEGMRTSWLMTGRHLVAHHLYDKMGYFSVSSFPRGMKRLRRTGAKPRGVKISDFRKADQRRLSELYREHVAGGYGFTERQWNFLDFPLAAHVFAKDSIKVARRGKEIIGYSIIRGGPGMLSLVEVVAPKLSDFRAIVRSMESRRKGALALAGSLIWERQREKFRSLGYKISPVHWYRLMAKPLRKGFSRRQIEHAYGIDDGRFVFMALDGF